MEPIHRRSPETTPADETRVVLVKPGDVLVFGNVGGNARPDVVKAVAGPLRDELGLRYVVFFAEDIDLAAVPAAVIDREANRG